MKKIDFSKFNSAKVLVIGDVMLDHYIWGEVTRISPEAPVPVVNVKKETYLPGGAANVANNITSLTGKVYIAGLIGNDEAGKKLTNILHKLNINTSCLIKDASRPTILKTRVIAHSQQVVRIDKEKKEEIGSKLADKLLTKIRNILPRVDAVCFSDYNKGLANEYLIDKVIDWAKNYDKIIVCDPKPVNLFKFKGVTIVTPNQKEAYLSINLNYEEVGDEKLQYVGEELLKKLNTEAILITRGEKGMSLFEKHKKRIDIPALASEVYDVTGAGDTVLATLTLSLSIGYTIQEAVKLANAAAAVVVRKVGTATCTITELQELSKKVFL